MVLGLKGQRLGLGLGLTAIRRGFELCKCLVVNRHFNVFTDGSRVPAQGIFMTSTSGVDNNAMSSSQPDSVVPLAGLPSYDDVIAHSDIYASSFYNRRISSLTFKLHDLSGARKGRILVYQLRKTKTLIHGTYTFRRSR